MADRKLKEIYEHIISDPYVLKIYEQVNEKMRFVIDHGLLHVSAVLKYIERICDIIQCGDKTRYLSLIAGALHDVGRLRDRDTHALLSAEFAREYLWGKIDQQDIETIAYAISHHERESFDYTTDNDVAWILIFADKMDYTRSRYIPALMNEKYETKYSYAVHSIGLDRKDDTAYVNISLYEDFPNFSEIFQKNTGIYKRALGHFGFSKVEINISLLADDNSENK